MAKLKTRTNQPVEDTEGLLNHLSQNGNITEIGGNVEINGNLNINGNLTGNSIVENMDGYSIQYLGDSSTTDFTNDITYVGICKNGNKLTFVISGAITRLNSSSPSTS